MLVTGVAKFQCTLEFDPKAPEDKPAGPVKFEGWLYKYNHRT